MSKGKKYKIPHKYLSKYPVRKTISKRYRYKIIGGKNGEKAKFKYFRHKELWKTLEGHISMRRLWLGIFGFWD